MHWKYHEIVVFLKYHKKLYFLKYFYTGLGVQTTVCMIWFFSKKYNWKYHSSAILGTVSKCPKGTGGTWEKNTTKSCVFYKQYICSAGTSQPQNFEPCTLQPQTPMGGVEKFMVEKSGVEKSGVGMSCNHSKGLKLSPYLLHLMWHFQNSQKEPLRVWPLNKNWISAKGLSMSFYPDFIPILSWFYFLEFFANCNFVS